jgi:hypothetical protein
MTRICEVLEQLSRAAQTALERHEAFFANERAALTLISGLAEGTDRMAAQGAIEQGLSLTAILPLEIETYEEGFKQQSSRAEYRELISKATTLELCGDPKRKPRAYEAAGLTILDNSDIVLAVWDGETSAGRGGTVELIEIAAERGLPIIHIDTTQRHPPRLIWGGLAKFPFFRVDLTDLSLAGGCDLLLPIPSLLRGTLLLPLADISLPRLPLGIGELGNESGLQCHVGGSRVQRAIPLPQLDVSGSVEGVNSGQSRVVLL